MFNEIYTSAKSLAKELVLVRGPSISEMNWPDQQGRVWVVTGATSGIGTQTAMILAAHRAKVWLGGRNESKLQNTISEIKREHPAANVDYFIVDYEDLTTIAPGVKKLLKAETRLDGIIHNAGVMVPPQFSQIKQEYDTSIGVNNLGPMLLQTLLDPLFIKTAESNTSSSESRIVWLSSIAHVFAPPSGVLDWDHPSDPKDNPRRRYCVSKTISYIQSIQWTKHHPDVKALSLSVHPGLIKTELFRNTSFLEKGIIRPFLWSPVYGAYNELYAALSPKLHNDDNNVYIVPFARKGEIRPDIYAAARDDRGEKLWNWMNKAIEPYTI